MEMLMNPHSLTKTTVIARSMAEKPCDVAISRYGVMGRTIHRWFFHVVTVYREIAAALRASQ